MLHKAAIGHKLRFGLYTKVPGTYKLRFSYKNTFSYTPVHHLLTAYKLAEKEPDATLSLETAIELIMIPGHKVCE